MITPWPTVMRSGYFTSADQCTKTSGLPGNSVAARAALAARLKNLLADMHPWTIARIGPVRKIRFNGKETIIIRKIRRTLPGPHPIGKAVPKHHALKPGSHGVPGLKSAPAASFSLDSRPVSGSATSRSLARTGPASNRPARRPPPPRPLLAPRPNSFPRVDTAPAA